MALKRVAIALLLTQAAAGVGTALPPYKHRRGFFARGGGFAIGNAGPSEEIEALAGESFDWLANRSVGAPAALVAGAVIATMIDQADFLKTTKKDTKLWARFTKRAAHILLISAFALSVFSIFATTVTGTMLKSLGDRDIAEEYEETISPMGFLHKNLPFEFLISRFSFLQGLLHWIAGVALMYIGNAPAAGGKASTKMFYFIGTSLMSALLLMIAFLNKHMNFYSSYLHMIADFHLQFFQQYFLCRPCTPVRPMAWLAAAVFTLSCKYFYEAIMAEDDDEDHGKRE